jgi:hypothetical protein
MTTHQPSSTPPESPIDSKGNANDLAQSKERSACAPNPDATGNWECTQCGLYGPWEGVICMNCGTRAKAESGITGAGRG